jgi:hypothetical protein
MDEDLRRFLDALLERHAGITQEMINVLSGLQTEIVDQREQIRANTEATWRMLDRLGPAGSSD